MTDSGRFGAAVFDMDGLLIDSEPLWRRAERRVFATVGVHLTDDMCRQTMGLRIDEVIRYWHARHPWSGRSATEVEHDILDEMEQGIRADGAALPGVHHAIDHLAGRGLALGLASSSPPRLIDCVIERLGLRDCFGAVCSAMDEPAGKPDPSVYLSAARQLGVVPRRCLAIEDSPAGLQSALAAGMFTVHVPDAEHAKQPRPPSAHATLDSLEELSLDAIDARAGAIGFPQCVPRSR